jgi:hypothetical protein
MNSEPVAPRPGLALLIGIAGCFLIVAGLGYAIYRYTQPAPLGEDRAAVRSKALTELRAAETEALNHVAWIDQGKGLVRLRIEDAKNLVLREWQNPSAARSNLIERVEKATFVPPPPKPKPSALE